MATAGRMPLCLIVAEAAVYLPVNMVQWLSKSEEAKKKEEGGRVSPDI